MNKKELRIWIKNRRDALSKAERVSESDEVCKKVIELKWYREAKKILSFMNFGSEIEIERLNERVIADGKELFLPRVEKNGELSIVKYGEGFSIGQFGIREPVGKSYTGELDMIVIPGLAFDREGNRLGYGKGYYDRLLERYSDVVKIAPIYEIQLVEAVPVEEHDKKIDLIILKNRTIELKKY